MYNGLENICHFVTGKLVFFYIFWIRIEILICIAYGSDDSDTVGMPAS